MSLYSEMVRKEAWARTFFSARRSKYLSEHFQLFLVSCRSINCGQRELNYPWLVSKLNKKILKQLRSLGRYMPLAMSTTWRRCLFYLGWLLSTAFPQSQIHVTFFWVIMLNNSRLFINSVKTFFFQKKGRVDFCKKQTVSTHASSLQDSIQWTLPHVNLVTSI